MADRLWLLVDSSSVLHRCFHGYVAPQPGLWNGRTMDVAALAGYVAYTHKLRKEFQFDHLVHVLDASTASHYRARMYPEYKANRGETDPFLSAQKQMLPKVLSALGEPIVCHHGYEADDVLGTLVEQARKIGDTTMVITQDKDLLQLVGENVVVTNYVKDGNNFNVHKFYETDNDVMAKLGVRPDQVADLLALIGDDIDNIPGLPDVGPKTATQWLQEHGDLDTLLTHADSLKGKRAESLRSNRDALALYRKLTLVCRDVPGIELEKVREPGLPDATARAQVLSCLGWPADWTWDHPVPSSNMSAAPARKWTP